MAENRIWPAFFEGFILVAVAAGIVVACYFGCNRKKPETHAVTCPACGAKLELKEAGK